VTYEGQPRDDSVEDLPDLGDVGGVLEAGVAHADDLVQVVLDPLVRPLGRNLGSEALEVASQLLGL
jgi:hypothetical protein